MPEGTRDVSSPEEANNHYTEDPERSRRIDLNALITLLFLHPKLGPIHHSYRGTRKRGPSLFRKGFHVFIQRHHSKRDYWWRHCLQCNADFLVKRDRKTKRGESFWVNISEGIDEELEGYGSGGSSESWSDLVRSGDTTSVSDVSFPETGTDASNVREGERDDQRLQREGDISPENLGRICERCKAIWSAAGRIEPLEEREKAVEDTVEVSDETRQRLELSESTNFDGTAQTTHQPYGGTGNIPTVEEVIRQQELMDDENDPSPETLLKKSFKRITSWLTIVVQILLIAPIAVPGAAISILASVIIAELGVMTKLFDLILALTLGVVHGYTTFIMDVPRLASASVGSLSHFLKHSPEIITWMAQRLCTTLALFLFGLLALLWAIVTDFSIEIDRFGFREILDTLTLDFSESIADFIIAILELYPRQLFIHILRFLRALFKATVEIASPVGRACYNLIGAILSFGFFISEGYRFLTDSIYFLRKCTFPDTRGTSY